MTGRRKKLVLVVVDAMRPAMLRRALAEDRVPAMARVIAAGHLVEDCVAAFPSVTPVCAASIATGTAPDRHLIPGMTWYHRGEERYVEYGTSFRASQTFGFLRSLTDTIYNMNLEHLAPEARTVFESLDDAGLRTACTTYLIYRGRHRHEVSTDTPLTRIASTVFRHAVYGPRELFYADLFASRRTPCRSTLGMPGVRDQHGGCVAEQLVKEDAFDFLLLSLPDNDTHSHKEGPDAQVESLAAADRQIMRMMDAGGGPDAFLEQHAVVVCSDHSQSLVEESIDLFAPLERFGVLAPNGNREAGGGRARVAACPNSRAAQVYVLDREDRDALVPQITSALLAVEGVDLVMRRTGHPDGEVAVQGHGGEVRFAAGGALRDLHGAGWSVEGNREVLDLQERDGVLTSRRYPDALGRVWAALRCRTAGEVLVSAAPGYEFLDWGRTAHVGGGSHGSLHAVDSLAALMWCGTGPSAGSRAQWTLRDVSGLVRDHFGVAGPV